MKLASIDFHSFQTINLVYFPWDGQTQGRVLMFWFNTKKTVKVLDKINYAVINWD